MSFGRENGGLHASKGINTNSAIRKKDSVDNKNTSSKYVFEMGIY